MLETSIMPNFKTKKSKKKQKTKKSVAKESAALVDTLVLRVSLIEKPGGNDKYYKLLPT